MRNVLSLSVATCLALGLAGRAAAQEAPRAVLEKAIQASGGAEKLGKFTISRSKFKGTGEFEGVRANLTGEVLVQLPRQMKLDLQVEVQGQNVTLLYVVNGAKGWIQMLGQTTEIKGHELEEQKESLHAEYVQMLVPLLRDKSFTLAPLGDLKVNGRDAVGIQVAQRGHKDVNLYFDKATWLLAKVERRIVEENGNQEATEGTYYSDYRKVDGVQVPMKLQVYHDDKKILEGEVTEFQFLDRVEEGEFAAPGGGEK